MSDDRPPVYWEDDTLVIRASAIGGSCLWELAAWGQGLDPAPLPDNLRRAFDQGDYYEPIILDMLQAEGWTLFGAQQEMELVVGPDTIIRMHPDARGYRWGLTTETRVVEAKALSNDLWQTFVRKGMQHVIGEYSWQAACLSYGFDLPLTWVGYNKGNADGSDCPDQGRIHTQDVDTPLVDLASIRDKAAQIRALVEGDDLLDSGRTCDDPGHWPCRFLHFRLEEEGHETPPDFLHVGDDDQDRANQYIRDYFFHKGQEDESKQRKEAARDALLELGEGHKGIITDKWELPFVDSSRSSTDWASVPEALKKQLDKYKVKRPYRYIRGQKRRDA